jgi:hypothetical protein
MAEQNSYLNFKVDNSFKGFQDEQQDGWKDEWVEPSTVEPIVVTEEVANINLNTSPVEISPLPLPEAPADKSHLGLSGIETKVADEELGDVELAIKTKQPDRKSNASYRQSLGVKIETGRS